MYDVMLVGTEQLMGEVIQILGEETGVQGVQEAKNVEHRVLVPPNVTGKIARIRSGNMKVDDVVAELDGGRKLMMKQDWPVRQPRPTKNRMMPSVPLITGQRVMDFLFPIAKGGTAAIPGGFGTGKCVVGTTPILLADGTLLPIRDLYELLRGKGADSGPERFVHLASPLRVLTFDGDRVREGSATSIYRGRTAYLTEVRLRRTFSYTVTVEGQYSKR